MPTDTVLYLLLPLHAAAFGVTLAEAGLLLAANRLVRILGCGRATSGYERRDGHWRLSQRVLQPSCTSSGTRVAMGRAPGAVEAREWAGSTAPTQVGNADAQDAAPVQVRAALGDAARRDGLRIWQIVPAGLRDWRDAGVWA